jgi:hypothetical protein
MPKPVLVASPLPAVAEHGVETVGFCLSARPRKTPFAPIALIRMMRQRYRNALAASSLFTTCVSTASVALLTFFTYAIFVLYLHLIFWRENMARPLRLIYPGALYHITARDCLIGNALKCVRVLRKSGRAFWRLHLNLNFLKPGPDRTRRGRSYFFWGGREEGCRSKHWPSDLQWMILRSVRGEASEATSI